MGNKTVEIKEVASNNVRIFRDRKPITVNLPEEVVSQFGEDSPISVSITPMTHDEAEIRKRVKSRISSAMVRANSAVGIKKSDVTNFLIELDLLNKSNEKLSEEEQYERLSEFQEKWEWFQEKTDSRDMAEVEKAEDEVRLNAVKIVAANCVSINFKDSSVDVDTDTIDMIHPDLFFWILSKIEENSYLTENEIMGF